MKKRRVRRKLAEIKRTPNPSAVKNLCQLVELAEAGNITSFVIVYQLDGEAMVQRYVGLQGASDYFKYIGALEVVKSSLIPKGK